MCQRYAYAYPGKRVAGSDGYAARYGCYLRYHGLPAGWYGRRLSYERHLHHQRYGYVCT
jgi:hypothetical protein